jgi:hypothetical protein
MAKYRGGTTISVVFLVTDGASKDGTAGPRVANDIRNIYGGTIFGIGIEPDQDGIDQLHNIANQPPETYVRIVNDAGLAFSSLVDYLVDTACIQVDSVTPDAVCIGESVHVNITGKGFGKAQNLNALKCRFGNYVTPAKFISNTKVSCESPASVNMSQHLYLEIEIFSNKFTQSNVTFHFMPCTPAAPFDWLLLAYIAAAVVPFLIFLCWFIWPLLVGAKRKGEQQQHPVPLNEDISQPPSGKKWADVDTSKYVWSRDGGTARPLPVKWGELGPTAGAGHLEATGYKEGIDEPLLEGQNKPGCCSRCCFSCQFCCASCYRRCADCRPHRG